MSSLAISPAALAADENGKFAIKGGGLQTCEKFTKAMEDRSPDVALYGGWIEGFVTAQNQHNENTFDVTPWQTTQTLLELTRAVCNQAKTEGRFIDAFAGVFRLLAPSRLTEESDVVGVTNGENSSVAYREILKRVQKVLRDSGYDIPNETGDLDANAVKHLMDYQTKKGLVASGLPDQPTLYSLFFKK
jgi:hypothetical protein